MQCYVDALGPSPQWQAKLSSIFPSIQFTVCPKADSLFKIVGAASIIAKVTRDRYVHQWVDPEDANKHLLHGTKRKRGTDELDVADETEAEVVKTMERGSGYPSDPKTQAYLREEIDPVFGYKGVVRFSWATVKVLLDKQGVECKWSVSPVAGSTCLSDGEGSTRSTSLRRRNTLAPMRMLGDRNCGRILV